MRDELWFPMTALGVGTGGGAGGRDLCKHSPVALGSSKTAMTGTARSKGSRAGGGPCPASLPPLPGGAQSCIPAPRRVCSRERRVLEGDRTRLGSLLLRQYALSPPLARPATIPSLIPCIQGTAAGARRKNHAFRARGAVDAARVRGRATLLRRGRENLDFRRRPRSAAGLRPRFAQRPRSLGRPLSPVHGAQRGGCRDARPGSQT
jgi:hypothetical protein